MLCVNLGHPHTVCVLMKSLQQQHGFLSQGSASSLPLACGENKALVSSQVCYGAWCFQAGTITVGGVGPVPVPMDNFVPGLPSTRCPSICLSFPPLSVPDLELQGVHGPSGVTLAGEVTGCCLRLSHGSAIEVWRSSAFFQWESRPENFVGCLLTDSMLCHGDNYHGDSWSLRSRPAQGPARLLMQKLAFDPGLWGSQVRLD